MLEIKPFGLGSRIGDCKIYDRVKKTNKSELLNYLTYRGLIYNFEVGTKTFRLKCRFSGRRSNKKLTKTKKWTDFFFLRLEADFFLALKPSL